MMAGSNDSRNGNKGPPMHPRQGPAFSQTQMSQIHDMLHEMLAQNDVLASQMLQSHTLAQTNLQATGALQTEPSPSVKPLDIGYFFLNMPLDWGDLDMVEKEGKMYYQNVYAFMN